METETPIDQAFFSDLERPTSFYILRHGETVANAQSRIQGRPIHPGLPSRNHLLHPQSSPVGLI